MPSAPHRLSALSVAVFALLAPAAWAQTTAPAGDQPEAATGRAAREAVQADSYMVTAANPLAVEAGAAVLAEGGTAVDAMIATQLVLNLVEPQSSGIGGGAFLLYHDAESGQTIAYDGRETAPKSAGGDLFLGPDGAPLEFMDAVVGGRSVGTPGTLKLLEAAHDAHGKLPLERLFRPAIELAEAGFTVSPRLAALVAGESGERLGTYGPTRDTFFPGGEAIAAGDTLKNPAFAETLRLILKEGTSAFYTGALAQEIVATVQGATGNPGLLSLEDLAAYRVMEREPVCFDYRAYEVCGMGPPSSGALTIGQILGFLEHFDLPSMGPESVDAWHLFAEAGKLAYADRALYMADADFTHMPEGLLDQAYLTARAQLIHLDTALPVPVAPGNPPWTTAELWAPDRSEEQPATSHVSIVDAEGNAVALTTTIENGFGSHLMVGGFLLNNELTDFSFTAEENGRPVANRVEGGKRPRSSMAPTLVFDAEGELVLVIGSPGGSRIIPYVAEVLVGVLDWGLDVQEAIDLGHVANRNGKTDLEAGTAVAAFQAALEARGHGVNVMPLDSGLHGIEVTPAGLVGGADPRREGVVMGD